MSITTMSFIISGRSTLTESDRRRNSGHLCRSIIIPRYFEGRDQDEVLVDKDRKESRKQICDKMQKCCNKGMLF